VEELPEWSICLHRANASSRRDEVSSHLGGSTHLPEVGRLIPCSFGPCLRCRSTLSYVSQLTSKPGSSHPIGTFSPSLSRLTSWLPRFRSLCFSPSSGGRCSPRLTRATARGRRSRHPSARARWRSGLSAHAAVASRRLSCEYPGDLRSSGTTALVNASVQSKTRSLLNLCPPDINVDALLRPERGSPMLRGIPHPRSGLLGLAPIPCAYLHSCAPVLGVRR
jgi:hypothetical protein